MNNIDLSYPGLVTTSLSTLTASSLDMFSKFVSLTCSIISPGSILPSRATAPPIKWEEQYQIRHNNNFVSITREIRSCCTIMSKSICNKLISILSRIYSSNLHLLTFHYWTDIYTAISISKFITLSDYWNAQEIYSIHVQGNANNVQRHCWVYKMQGMLSMIY